MPKSNYDLRQIAKLRKEGWSNRKIAEYCSVSRNKINEIVRIMNDKLLSCDDVIQMSNEEINSIFFKAKKSHRDENYEMPDLKQVTKYLARPNTTVSMAWENYCDVCKLNQKKAYSMTQFRTYVNQYLKEHQFTEVLHHKAGERIEVDWAGQRPKWFDPYTGEIIYGYLFVSVLSFSGYAYAQCTPDMKMHSWIDCHNKMFEYFGGVAQTLVPDNLKTGVTKHTKDEIILNPTYKDMARHYDTLILPARVRHPKDKSLVENTVGKLTRYIISRLEDYQFFNIDEYNQQLLAELDKFNKKPFQKKEGSRYSNFIQFEKDILKPLPKASYIPCEWKDAKVQSNSHIAFRKCFYSVPYQYIGKTVRMKIYDSYFIVYWDDIELCRHNIITNRTGAYDTDISHMPPNSYRYGEWNSTRFLNWAKKKGPYTYQVIYNLFDTKIPEQRMYNTAHSILKLGDSYSNQRLENACRYVLTLFTRPNYKNLKTIIKNNEDISQNKGNEQSDVQDRPFVRGGDYFE